MTNKCSVADAIARAPREGLLVKGVLILGVGACSVQKAIDPIRLGTWFRHLGIGEVYGPLGIPNPERDLFIEDDEEINVAAVKLANFLEQHHRPLFQEKFDEEAERARLVEVSR